MILMVDFIYPSFKGAECGQAFIDVLQARPIPEYVRVIDIYQYGTAEGIRGHAFYELEKGRENEGTKAIAASTMDMYSAVEGYNATTRIVIPLAEAYSMIGSQSPVEA